MPIACFSTAMAFSKYNEKCLLSGDSPLIKIGAPDGCNSWNFFPRPIACRFHPRLTFIHLFSYFITKEKFFLPFYQAMARKLVLHSPLLNTFTSRKSYRLLPRWGPPMFRNGRWDEGPYSATKSGLIVSSSGTIVFSTSLWTCNAREITPYLVAPNSFIRLWCGPMMK